jgi:ubiquinone/menaquinone biosynthesis C-methylase UbiE
LNSLAAEYDRAFSHVSAHFLPFLLRALRLAPGQRVLDVATGTGISAQAALKIVGPAGSVLATDISPEIVDRPGSAWLGCRTRRRG